MPMSENTNLAQMRARETARKFNRRRQRWLDQPDLPPCWKGDQREWRLEADHFKGQLWCRHWQDFINPNGFACELCEKQVWPLVERWRAHRLPMMIRAQGKRFAQERLARAVERLQLKMDEALDLAREQGLGKKRIEKAGQMAKDGIMRRDYRGCKGCKEKMLRAMGFGSDPT